jgi:hypothetical protein
VTVTVTVAAFASGRCHGIADVDRARSNSVVAAGGRP